MHVYDWNRRISPSSRAVSAKWRSCVQSRPSGNRIRILIRLLNANLDCSAPRDIFDFRERPTPLQPFSGECIGVVVALRQMTCRNMPRWIVGCSVTGNIVNGAENGNVSLTLILMASISARIASPREASSHMRDASDVPCKCSASYFYDG